MITRQKIEERIGKKQQEINALEQTVREAKAYILALQDTLRMFPKSGAEAVAPSFRNGSDVGKAYEVLKSAGVNLALNELLKRMGKEVNKDNRISVSGSLGSYVRRNSVFTRPAPNTFGLVEFEAERRTEPEPPDDFGTDVPPSKGM